MGQRNNFPNNKLNEMDANAVQGIVTNIRQLYEKGKPKDDEECERRINDFFEFCERTSTRPGIETLCMSLHITRQTLLNWTRGEGCTPKRKALAQEAKSFIGAFLEQAALSGKINPATSIFLMKNWLGYKDSVMYETASSELLPSESAKMIAERRHLLGGDTMPEKPISQPLDDDDASALKASEQAAGRGGEV